MPFKTDVAYADEVYGVYGRYHSTFHSQTDQVLALLFEQNGLLVAHVSFPSGLDPEYVTDAYFAELSRYAADHGFGGRLRVIYSDSSSSSSGSPN